MIYENIITPQDYTVAYYPDMPSKFGELLLRMPELQRVCQVSLKIFLGGRYFNGASSKKLQSNLDPGFDKTNLTAANTGGERDALPVTAAS